MKIRLATPEDIVEMKEIFDTARQFQLERGIIQWAEGYPSKELILEDMKQKAAYVAISKEKEFVGVISVFTAPDPTYTEIEGAWLNDEPYATVHRIASSGKVRGVGQDLLRWVQSKHANVRIDTHKDNEPMKYVLKKLGFHFVGIIQLENGEFREAYHYVKKEE